MERIILDNWDSEHPILTSEDLGWNEEAARDAGSSDAKAIFEYYIECGLNIRFFSTIDNEFYCLFQENLPMEVRHIPKRPNPDSPYLLDQVSDNSHVHGNVVSVCDTPCDAWDILSINGRSIGEVLANSVIIAVD